MGASLNRAKRAQFSPIRKPRSAAVSSPPLATTRSNPGNREWFAGVGEGWAPGLDTVFRIILEGALAEHLLLADLIAEPGARPVILRAKTLGGSCSAVATILFSLRAPSSDLVAQVERYLVQGGARVEIFGHAQPPA
jgi:hypothetical protein